MNWLQGQVTQDLRPLQPGHATRGLLCQPTGQLVAHLEIWRQEGDLLLLVDRLELPALLRRIEEMVIMEEVTGEVLPLFVAHSIGPDRPTGDLVRPRDRTGFGGWDVLVTQVAEPEDHEAYMLAHGEVVAGVETDAKTLPPELGPAFEAATISYAKGCYTGQEVLMRMHSRGHPNREWVGLRTSHPLPAGDSVLDPQGKAVGRVTRSALHPTLGPIAGAFVRREALYSDLIIGSVAARAEPFPIKL